jgi:hypothetical protein
MAKKILCDHPFMKIENIPINETISTSKEKNISPVLRPMFNILLLVVQEMIRRLRLKSKNSSKPPTTDPNKKKEEKVFFQKTRWTTRTYGSTTKACG